MKLSEIQMEVVKAVEKIVGTMRPIDLETDIEIDDFTMGTANGHVKEFENVNLYITCDLSDSDYPEYLILTLSKDVGDVGYMQNLIDEIKMPIDNDTYTNDDLEQAIKIAQETAQEFVREDIINGD